MHKKTRAGEKPNLHCPYQLYQESNSGLDMWHAKAVILSEIRLYCNDSIGRLCF